MKKSLQLLFLLFLMNIFSLSLFAQTNVSGGIYSNTTWTLANSPYIVTDTVVVFPGVTLTIEPGVVVKFDSAITLEIRQGHLIAQGTSNDSIIFTSNYANPNNNNRWYGIYFTNVNYTNFRYCRFSYSWNGIYLVDTAIVSHSKFDHIIMNGIWSGYATVDSSYFLNNSGYGLRSGSAIIDSCKFISSYNGTEISTGSISNCIYIDNKIGLDGGNTIINSIFDGNETGSQYSGHFLNCKFYNNSSIGVFYSTNVDSCKIINNHRGVGFINTLQNCIIDSNDIGIWDFLYLYNCLIEYNDTGIYGCGYNASYNIIENNNIGIYLDCSDSVITCNKICNNITYDVYYTYSSNSILPNNYWCTTDSNIIETHIYDGYDNINYGLINFMPMDTLQCYLITDVPANVPQNISFNIYPNPVNDYLTLETPEINTAADLRIFNILGEEKYHSSLKDQKTDVDVSAFANGVYIIEVNSGNKIIRQKFVKQ